MGTLWNFLTLPFDLPVAPVWSWIGMGVIGVIAFVIAWIVAGNKGDTKTERRIIHWSVRMVVFIVLWALSCGIISLIRVFEGWCV